MIKKLYIALYIDENILQFNEDSGNVKFSCNEMSILNVDLNINLDSNVDEDDRDAIILIRIQVWHIKFEKCKELKKKKINEELIPIVWHPKRWWNFRMSEDNEKEIEPIFTGCF